MLSVYLSGVAVLAWRKFHFAGVWSSIFVTSIPIVLYLDVLAVIVQVFKRIPSLVALAPTLSESPFLVTQFVVLMPFAMYSAVAAKRFHDEPRTGREAVPELPAPFLLSAFDAKCS